MAGLLGDVLPYIYSRGNALRRGLLDTIQNPVASFEQTAGLLQDKHREQQNLLAQAFSEPRDPFKVTDQRALNQASTNMLMGPLGFAPAGITAWHGSPHTFDKFDSSKIGTGEGAQAYGHGLYLAEAPAVAKEYAGALSAAKANKPVGNVDLTQAYQNMPTDVPDSLLAARRDFRALKDMGELLPADRRDFLAAVKDNIAAAQGGALYKVDLPDDAIAKMLDWDKPLSQQPEAVRAALSQDFPPLTPSQQSLAATGKWRSEALDRQNYSGSTLLGELFKKHGSGGGAEEYLRKRGIPGIRYLDGGSRATGGTSNFVVFPGEENILKILERNGQPVR
jgi:hypothetical protein